MKEIRGLKGMERYPMFLDQKNQYYSNDNNTQSKAIPFKIPMTFFIIIGKKPVLIFMWNHKRPRILNKKKRQDWRHHKI
jgi:hypothetical protein